MPTKTILFRAAILAVAVAGAMTLWAGVANDRPLPVVLGCPSNPWRELGTITSQQSYPAVGARNYVSVTGLTGAATVIWNLPDHARKAMMSFQTTADADSTVVVLIGFAGRLMEDQYGNLSLNDDAVYIGALALTGGKQVGSHSNFYVDTITSSDNVFAISDSGNDRRCIVSFNTDGYRTIVGIATTLASSSTLYAYGRLY